MLEPLLTYATLSCAGYTSCEHPRVRVNTSGDLLQPLTKCMDCGAVDGKGGSMDHPREPWIV